MAHSPTIDHAGLTIPRVGLGTWQLEPEVAYGAVRDALELGVRHIDTAKIYGNEEAVGRAVRDSGIDRDQIWVTTKIWREDLAPRDLAHAAKASLDRLGLDHVDLLLQHWPAPSVAPIGDSVRALAAMREAGLARAVGVSNFTSSQVDEVGDEVDLFTNQVEYHVYRSQEKVRAATQRHDMLLTAYSPLASGGDRPSGDVLATIADEVDATVEQVMLAWLLHQDDVVVIPRSSNRDHIASNLAALSVELTDEQIARLDALPKDRRMIDPPFAPRWDAS